MISLLSSLCLAMAALEPYTLDWQTNRGALVDASHLLQAPAGKRGFVRAQNGHLTTSRGRLRLWGINITGAANEPEKQDAPVVAALLARHGINCVRMHFLDRTAPNGIIDAKRADSRAFDAEQLDRLDFFIAHLQRRGIYVDLNLNVGRMYKAGDGVRDFELLGYAKAVTYFDPRLIELQKEYARQLLTHRNPYTGREYRNDPGVALIELMNENSIVESWVSDRLLGEATSTHPGTWTDIPASYAKQLDGLYADWRKSRGEAPAPRLRKREFAAADPARFRSEAEFYMHLEDNFFQEMQRFLREDVQVKPLLLATSDHNHGISGYPLLSSAAKLDVVDGHIYWQHPSYTVDAATGRTTGFRIANTPMVNDPLHSTPVQLARSAVAGKPYIVSEVNHPAPAEHAAEGIPILTAYALLQDWDGLFWYTFEHYRPQDWKARQPGHFEFRPDPVKMTQLAANAFVFLRGDLRAAERTVLRGYSREQVVESMKSPWMGFGLEIPLRHAVRIASLDQSRAPDTPPPGMLPFVSDTRELTWRPKPGAVLVDSPRAQSIVGFTREHKAGTRNLRVDLDTTFAAVSLVSLDGRPIATSHHMVLSTGATSGNTGMRWNAERTSLTDWGAAPTVIEPVRGTIRLVGLKRSARIAVTALDGAGRAVQTVPAKRAEAGWEIQVGGVVTPWYRIDVQ